MRPPYNVSVLTQFVTERVLAHAGTLEQQAARIRTEREALFEALSDLRGVEAFPSEANFILVRVADADAINARLKVRKILVRNLHGSHPLLANCLRLTVGTPGENELLLAALAESV